MAKVKGTVILNARAFAVGRDRHAWARVLSTLSPEDREELASAIPMGWYDIRLYDRVNRALIHALGDDGGDGSDVMVAVGRYSAEQDLRTIHRLFLRVAHPAYVLERLGEFWGRFQDSGTWTVVRQGPDRVRATLHGWGSEDEATCVRLAAYTQRLFELVGAKDVELVRPHCRARGDDACVFLGRWR